MAKKVKSKKKVTRRPAGRDPDKPKEDQLRNDINKRRVGDKRGGLLGLFDVGLADKILRGSKNKPKGKMVFPNKFAKNKEITKSLVRAGKAVKASERIPGTKSFRKKTKKK